MQLLTFKHSAALEIAGRIPVGMRRAAIANVALTNTHRLLRYQSLRMDLTKSTGSWSHVPVGLLREIVPHCFHSARIQFRWGIWKVPYTQAS